MCKYIPIYVYVHILYIYICMHLYTQCIHTVYVYIIYKYINAYIFLYMCIYTRNICYSCYFYVEKFNEFSE